MTKKMMVRFEKQVFGMHYYCYGAGAESGNVIRVTSNAEEYYYG